VKDRKSTANHLCLSQRFAQEATERKRIIDCLLQPNETRVQGGEVKATPRQTSTIPIQCWTVTVSFMKNFAPKVLRTLTNDWEGTTRLTLAQERTIRKETKVIKKICPQVRMGHGNLPCFRIEFHGKSDRVLNGLRRFPRMPNLEICVNHDSKALAIFHTPEGLFKGKLFQ